MHLTCLPLELPLRFPRVRGGDFLRMKTLATSSSNIERVRDTTEDESEYREAPLQSLRAGPRHA